MALHGPNRTESEPREARRRTPRKGDDPHSAREPDNRRSRPADPALLWDAWQALQGPPRTMGTGTASPAQHESELTQTTSRPDTDLVSGETLSSIRCPRVASGPSREDRWMPVILEPPAQRESECVSRKRKETQR